MYEGKKAALSFFSTPLYRAVAAKKKARIIPSSFDSPSQGHLIEVREIY
jgi:hypothetical protein